MNILQQLSAHHGQILQPKRLPKIDHQSSLKFKNHHKIITIVTFVGLFATYRLLYSPSFNKNCLLDKTHEWTFPVNRWIAANFARPLIGFGQILMDISITSMLIYWMLFVNNFRVLWVAALMQFGRQLLLRVSTMPFESYTVWQNPGFPTWTVEYGHTSDYFYSGHTGTIAVIFFEARKLNLPKFTQLFLVASTVYIVVMLLVMLVHYTADIFAGWFFAGWFYELVDGWLEWLDVVINSPYRLFEIVKERVKNKLEKNEEGTSLFDIQHG